MCCGPRLSVAVRDRGPEKVLREADGSVKLVVVRPHTDGKVFASGVAPQNRTVRAGRSRRTQARGTTVHFASLMVRTLGS